MNSNQITACCLALFIGLASFRPWKSINRTFGLRDLTDSVKVLTEYQDSVLMNQPVQVVLAPTTADSIANVVIAHKDSLADVIAAQKDSIADFTQQTKDLDKKLAVKKKENQKKASALVTEKQIEAMVKQQTQDAKAGGKTKFDGSANRPDDKTDLEKEINHKQLGRNSTQPPSGGLPK